MVNLSAGAVTFDPNVRYSKDVIDACIYDFKANTKQAGFNTYDANGTKTATSSDARGFDYVPGLVAKGVMEAVNYYQNEDFAKPWFYSIEDYGNSYYSSGFSNTQADLDKLNAVKLYFGLKEAANTGVFTHVNASTISNCNTALTKAAQALTNYNTKYAITSATSQAFCGAETYTGGWWHKSDYANEMWCDGQYMGPALLAELVHNGYTLTGKTETECWDIIANQFNMTWGKLWDSEKKLLWHAFSAKPEDDTNWADQTAGSHYGVSAEYWGRAEGWYFLALVDVLELMPSSHPQYATLKQHLNDIADGLKDRQLANGCWAQLLQYAEGYTPAGGTNSNYAEASATAIFAAAYLKGMRLDLFTADYETVAKNAYQGFIEQFYTVSGSTVILRNSCASAGLNDSRKGDAKYYLDGSDVTKITSYTEGKPLGAFILAAVEYERAYPPVADGCNCLQVSVR